MLAIDRSLLAAVSGGASDPRNLLVADGLGKKFGSEGVVSLIGQPKYRPLDRSTLVHGKFDVNALEGGDTKYTFDARLNGRGQLGDIHRKVFGAE